MEMIIELYKQLTKILVRKAQQPDENSIDKWSLDDLEAFRCYREDISDTLVNFLEFNENLCESLIRSARCTAMKFFMTTYWKYCQVC